MSSNPQGNCTRCEGRDDMNEYAHFCSALTILTFSEDDSWEISKLLAAILHLGNVKFEGQHHTVRWMCRRNLQMYQTVFSLHHFRHSYK